MSFDAKCQFRFADHFAPCLQLNEPERYRFMDAELYVSAMCKDAQTSTEILEWKDEFSIYNPPLNDFEPSYKTKILPPTTHSIHGSKGASLYVHFRQDNPDLIRLAYFAFYPFNGFQTVKIEANDPTKCFCFELAPVARHHGDWEHVTVFVKRVHRTQTISISHSDLADFDMDPQNWELYCVYASQHGKYSIALSQKYYNLFQRNENFKTKFLESAVHKKKQSETENVHLIQTVNNNGRNAKIFVAFNSHANYFAQDTFTLKKIDVANSWFMKLMLPGIKAIHFVDCTEFGTNTNATAGCRYFAFDVENGDDEKSQFLDKELYPDTLEKVTLLVKDENEKWFKIEDPEKNGYEPKSCNWADIGPNFRWGETQQNSFRHLKVPGSMQEAKNNDANDVVATVCGLVKGGKRLSNVLQRILETFSSDKKLGHDGRAPQCPTHHKKYWGHRRDKTPYLFE